MRQLVKVPFGCRVNAHLLPFRGDPYPETFENFDGKRTVLLSGQST